MKKNVLKAVVGGFAVVALLAGLFVSVSPAVRHSADLVWPENFMIVR